MQKISAISKAWSKYQGKQSRLLTLGLPALQKNSLGWQPFHLLPLILFSVRNPLKTDTQAKAAEDLQKKYQDKTL